ncbi:MAG: hypothetical protein Kow0042_18210 [Calditrichia bacterium]
MKRLLISILAMLTGLMLITGCQKDTGTPLSDEQIEQDARMEILTDDNSSDELSEYLIDWGIDDGSEDNMYDGFSSFSPDLSLPKILSPIQNVVRFGRKINRRGIREVEIIRVAEDTIYYRVTRRLMGKFIIFEKLDTLSGSPDTIVIHRKNLQHDVMRKAIFVKRTPNEDGYRNPRKRWRLAAVSLCLGESKPVPTVKIEKIGITTGSGDSLTFTDPLQTMLWIPQDIPTFLKGDVVTVTALVSNSTLNPVPDPITGATETVLLHFGINRSHHARKRFEYKGIDPATGFNIYQGSWTVREPAHPHRPFHAVVDVIDNGTIYDSDEQTYPYNSNTWGCPYRVVLFK